MAGFGQTFTQLVQQQQTPAPAATTGQGMNEDWFTQFQDPPGYTRNPSGAPAPGQPAPDYSHDWTPRNPDGSPVNLQLGGTIQPIPGQGTPSAPGTVITQNPGGTSGGATAGSGDPQQYFQSLIQGLPPTPQSLVSLESQLNARGIQVLRNAQGTAGKIKLPDGSIVDVIQGAGAGGQAWQWLGPGSGGAAGGGAGTAGGFGGMTFNSPYQNFTPPSLEDARNSPGYQFAQQQGMDAIQHSAAAKGTLLTGGTLKALQTYGTGLADQTYGNVFNRASQTNQANFNNGIDTNKLNTGNLFNLAKLGMPQ